MSILQVNLTICFPIKLYQNEKFFQQNDLRYIKHSF